MTASGVLGLLIVAVTGILAIQFAGPRVITYDVTENALLIRLGRRGPVLRRVPYEAITEIQVATFLDIVFAVRWLNRLIGSAVLLRLDRGWWRWLVISPSEPDRFVAIIRQRMRPVLVL